MVSKVATQVVDRPKIDLTPEHVAELELELSDGEQARCATGLELDEQVDVARGPERPLDGRAEEPKTADAVGRAERAKSLIINGNSLGQLHGRSLAGPVKNLPCSGR